MAANTEGTDLEILIEDFAERYQLEEETLRVAVREQLTALAAEKIAKTAFQESRATWGAEGSARSSRRPRQPE